MEERQDDKADAPGRLETDILAGGVAHDINNLLAVILGSVGLARRRLGDDALPPALPELQAFLDKIETATVRARGLAQELLISSRGGAADGSTTDLATVVRDAVALHSRSFGPAIEIRVEIEAGLRAAAIDGSRAFQIVQNLLINAGQAMEGEGLVRISLCESKPPTVPEAGGWLRIEVADSGPGIPAGFRELVFEPHWTGRGSGSGLGLGLAVCKSIVEREGGVIELGDAPEGGALFSVWLPATEAPSHGRASG